MQTTNNQPIRNNHQLKTTRNNWNKKSDEKLQMQFIKMQVTERRLQPHNLQTTRSNPQGCIYRLCSEKKAERSFSVGGVGVYWGDSVPLLTFSQSAAIAIAIAIVNVLSVNNCQLINITRKSVFSNKSVDYST